MDLQIYKKGDLESTTSPNLLNFNNELTSDPLKIANVFNNYFSSIGEKNLNQKQGSQIKITLTTIMLKTLILFLLHLQTMKVISIISSLIDNKSSGPNSIPTRVLTLLKKDISIQLVNIFYLFSFTH